MWTPHHAQSHLVIPHGATRHRPSWHRHTGPLPRSVLFPLRESLAQVIAHHDAEAALTVLESAVNLRLLPEASARGLIADASGRKREALKFFDPRAESGSETKVRLWLRRPRDLAARALGYTPVRLSYAQIHHAWPATFEHLDQILGTRRHLREPRPLS